MALNQQKKVFVSKKSKTKSFFCWEKWNSDKKINANWRHETKTKLKLINYVKELSWFVSFQLIGTDNDDKIEIKLQFSTIWFAKQIVWSNFVQP